MHHIVIIVIIVDFVLFCNVTCYTRYLLSCIYVNTTHLLNITCTLVAIGMILGKLECTSIPINFLALWTLKTNAFHFI